MEQTWREAVNVQTVLAEHMARLALDVVPVPCIHGGASAGRRSKGYRLWGRGAQEANTKAKPVLSEEVRLLAEAVRHALRA